MQASVLSTPQLRILEGLAELSFATNKQLTRFAYSHGCYTAIATANRQLFLAGYIGRTFRMINQNEDIAYLKEKGRRYLEAYGLDNLPKVPRSIPAHWLFQEHALAINDVVLIARELPGAIDATLDTLLTDRMLRRSPIPVPVGSGVVKYIPDAWLSYTVPAFTTPNRSLLVEIDRGTEQEGKWRRKVETIVAFSGRPVMERFGTRSFTVAVAALPLDEKKAEKRREHLMLWTRRELTRLGKEAWGGIFLFSANDAGTMTATDYFTGLQWYDLTGTPHALLAAA